QKISQFEANKENIQQDILNNLVVATQEIKQNTELLQAFCKQGQGISYYKYSSKNRWDTRICNKL
ncbi:hypothetical protein, partial [Helicobacter bilis]|uniref:hypothetical protein n=1 Tax=Helicobacter bilis TaxID=37372 RepID=UPI00188424F0